MEQIDIHSANEQEKDMAAHLLATSEPWITLRITEDQCRKNCHDPEYLLYMAYKNGNPAGIIILDPRGIAGSPYIKSIAVYPDFGGGGSEPNFSLSQRIFSGTRQGIFSYVSHHLIAWHANYMKNSDLRL